MTTVQIVGIAVVAAIVLLLVIALLVTRRRGSAGEEPAAKMAQVSFLDDAPQDTLSTLGKAEQPMEDITIDPGLQRQVRPADESAGPAAPIATGTDDREHHALGLDWGTSSAVLVPAAAEPVAAEEAAAESGRGGRRVPLSDIIVTTSHKMVDLQDPEVRRMLTDLVKYEIDQATHYRQQGQTIDAVLQLTEAEKISRALDMRESAAAIRTMMDDLRGQV